MSRYNIYLETLDVRFLELVSSCCEPSNSLTLLNILQYPLRAVKFPSAKSDRGSFSLMENLNSAHHLALQCLIFLVGNFSKPFNISFPGKQFEWSFSLVPPIHLSSNESYSFYLVDRFSKHFLIILLVDNLNCSFS